MIEAGKMLSGRYEVIEQVGVGGMSHVYKAKDIKLGRYVAIKVLKDEYGIDEKFVSRFKVEARSAASLGHSNIVNIYDVGEEGRTHFIVMEYLEGETLKEHINNTGRLNNQDIMRIGLGIASALDHAHKNHIIHRDIKPQNIMLTPDGKVKVMDFGIARVATDSTIEISENTTGSVHYIAPEQARGGYQDHRSDIYSLGIIIYEMATGTVPFDGDSAVNVALQQIHEPLPDPSVLNENIDANIVRIIEKATTKKTRDRYQNAQEIISDIKKSMKNPEEALHYEVEKAPEETVIMNHQQMKHIWSKSEVLEYGDKKDALDFLIKGLAIVLAFTIALIVGLYGFRYAKSHFLPASVEIPNLTGMEVEAALSELEDLGLIGQVVEERFDNDFDEGNIISHEPEEASVVHERTTVSLVVSKGGELATVPNVMNLTYKEAVEKLEEVGFSHTMTTDYSSTIPSGTVMNQTPGFGEKIGLNIEISIVVSNGPEIKMIEMPDVSLLPLDEAIVFLEREGFQIGTITYINSEEVDKDYVVSTGVEPGRMIKEGYVIDFIVSDGSINKEVKRTYIINNVADNGQREYTLKVTLELRGTESVIFEGKVDASYFPLQLDLTGTGTGVMHVYNNNTQVYQQSIFFSDEEAEEVEE